MVGYSETNREEEEALVAQLSKKVLFDTLSVTNLCLVETPISGLLRALHKEG